MRKTYCNYGTGSGGNDGSVSFNIPSETGTSMSFGSIINIAISKVTDSASFHEVNMVP